MRPDTLMRRPASSTLFALALIIFALAFAPEARAATLEVEGPQDTLAQPPAPVSNHCTLRKAIINANMNGMASPYPQCLAGDPGNDTITFLFPGTVTFELAGINEEAGLTGDLDITDSVTIVGHPDGTIIDAADLDRIFDINPSNATPGIVVTLRNLHITNGTGLGAAGAIQLRGATLILENCTISASVANGGDGGAIAMADGAVLNMTNTTVSGNHAAHHAGAIIIETGTANITNSTITGNTTGALFQNLTGGIRNTGTATLRNTIVAGNNPGGDIPNLDGLFTSLGYNVVGELGTTVGTPTIVPAVGDQLDISDALLNFGPLQSNGGPTPTHALLAGSIAIDKGHSSGSTTDQRGLTRPCDDAGITNATGGDGGDSGAFEVQTVCAGSNSNPDAIDDTFAVPEDSGPTIFPVLANDTDADGDTLTVTAVTQGAHGSVVINGGGASVSYTPAPNYFGPDTFTYTASDGNGGTDTANVSVTVTPVQDAPIANDDAASVSEDSAGNTINVIVNDMEVDGDPLTVVAVTPPANGSAVNNGDNTISYTPNPDFFGADSFTYTISDGQGGFDTATVNVTVTNVNDAPVATGDVYGMNQDTTLVVNAPGVLANDTDADGDSLTAALVTSTSNGSLAFNTDGSFVYTPNAGFTGLDSFTYQADDGAALSEVVTVNITVADTQGPNLTTSVATTQLWPPNHDLVNVGLAVSVTDNSGDPVTTEVFVFSDEDDLTPASPAFSPDARDIAPATLRLRAERDSPGDGRVYLILIVATDSSNNTSRNCLTVVVPHSNSKASRDAVGQQAQAALAHCAATGTPPAAYFLVGDGPVVGPKQ